MKRSCDTYELNRSFAFCFFALLFFLLPVWIYSQFGLLPDILIFAESFQSAIEGELLTNHPHYYQQIDGMGQVPSPGEKASMFGMHFRPFLFLLLPFYFLFPKVETLLFMQAALVASAVFPLYSLAKEKCDDKLSVNFLVCGCMLHPLTLGVTTGFFPSYIAISSLTWALYFFRQQRVLGFWLFLVVTLALKEILVLPVFLVGIYCFFCGKKLTGTLVCFISVSYLILCTEVIIPFFSIGNAYQFSSSFGGDSGSVYENGFRILQSPELLWEIIASYKVLIYLANIFIPFLFLPLFSWEVFLLLPIVSQNIFAVNIWYSLKSTGHLSAPILPFLALSLFAVFGRLHQRSPTIMRMFAVSLVLLCSLFSVSILSSTIFSDSAYKAAAHAVKKRIGSEDTVAIHGADTIGAHLVQTNTVSRFPIEASATWNIVVYDEALCRPSSQELDASIKGRIKFESMISNTVCNARARDCIQVVHESRYYPNHRQLNVTENKMKIVVLKNTCTEPIEIVQ